MNSIDTSLPQGFEMLEPFVGRWHASSAAERARRRLESTAQEREAFFEVAKDVLPSALTALEGKSPSQFDAPETRMMNLLLSFAHVALAVEIQGGDEPKQAALRRHMTITRASADC